MVDVVTASQWEPPDTIPIPRPIRLSMRRGIFALKQDQAPLVLRVTEWDKALIAVEARALGLDTAPFVRWSAVHLARELRFLRTGERVRIDI